jgi:hypothetical protein
MNDNNRSACARRKLRRVLDFVRGAFESLDARLRRDEVRRQIPPLGARRRRAVDRFDVQADGQPAIDRIHFHIGQHEHRRANALAIEGARRPVQSERVERAEEAGRQLTISAGIIVSSKAQLFEIVLALGSRRRLANLLDRRQQ